MRFPFRHPESTSTKAMLPRLRNAALGVTTAVALLASGVAVAPAFAANGGNAGNAGPTISSAVYSGAGTITTGGTLYAKSGTSLTLTATTSTDAGCVIVTSGTGGNATTLGFKTTATSSTPSAKTWVFPITAATGADGARGLTVGTSGGPNQNNNSCTGPGATASATYSVDNTGPTVAASLSGTTGTTPWYTGDVTVNWTATDAGVGVGAQPFKTETVTTDGTRTLTTPAQTDLLGNLGTAGGSVTVNRDATKPTITGKEVSNPNGTVTVTFSCTDDTSGIAATAGCLAAGSTTNAVTITPSSSSSTTIKGTATDAAGNTNTADVIVAQSDLIAPTVTGTPKTSPNNNGWYNGDVVIGWTCTDNAGGSGVKTAPADSTVTGEGSNQGVTSGPCTDNAGNSATGSVSGIKIDRTAPTTGISGTSNSWVNGAVAVTLAPSDNLSGVASTTYSVDGGTQRTGTSFSLSTEGDHTVTFFSTDKAGNGETPQTVHVKIDTTAPTIGHVFDPSAYSDGAWTNQNVTVTFDCADAGGSGLAGCTAPVTQSAETSTVGATVTGTATDNAGNSATDTATVRIDKTAPTITAETDSDPNANGWYNHDVTVRYSANDALSGVASVTADQVLTEGANQSAQGTATDAAGNSASDGVSGINIDETKPVLTGSYDKGWHTDDVTVTWTCTDAGGSGVDQAPANTVVSGEGSNLTATASCTDKAGNSTTTTVDGIQIDRHAPATTASVPDANSAGWYGSAVTVTLNATDNLSGIAATYYSVDGGATETYNGAFPYSTEGTHTISFWSKDGAGNVETPGAPITLNIDTTAPTTTIVNPISSASGWFVTSGITFAFDSGDSSSADAVSGVAATYYAIDNGVVQTYGQPFTDSLSDGQHTVTYWSVDVAGNEETHHSAPVNVDTTPPTITGSQSPAPNSFGWNNSAVTVHFDCADATSGSGLQTGVAGCSPDITLSNEGSDQSATGQAFDVAGNHSSTTYGPVSIDTTKPTLTGQVPAPNAAGWYNGDVPVKWVGQDGLSGIDPATQPADGTITGEGSNLSARPVAISDRAGNVSDAATVTGIKIDRTGPAITGAPTTKPNAAGWFNSAVTVDFKCSDPLLADGTAGSGVASCPTSRSLISDGAGQSVTSAPATDVAGNSTPGKTVDGINVDATAPTTTATATCTDQTGNGWCTGATAEVELAAQDQPGLSGVKEIHYSVNGGVPQVSAGGSAAVDVPLSGTGAATVTYWAVDNADNVESAKSVSLKWDNIAPTVTHILSPAANAVGWNNSDTTITFSAADDAGGSGVDPSTLSAPVTVSQETAGQVVNGSAKDTAGNTGTDSVTVKLDKTPPTITGSITGGKLGANGWYTGPVTVHFDCKDALSGIPATACPSDQIVSTDGANQSVTGTVSDAAGNSATATVSGINIDQTPPTMSALSVTNGRIYTIGGVPAPTCTATDDTSGVASCIVKVTGGTASGVGDFSYTASAADNAGNTTTATGNYSVHYRWDGFLQPINDTAHQIGQSISVFKAGSTVPVKFQLKNAAGTVVKAVTAPQWLSPVQGTAMSVPVNDTATAASVDSGSAFTYDATAQQYIYNWKTPSSGSGHWYNVGVKFDDGTTQYVTIGLK